MSLQGNWPQDCHEPENGPVPITLCLIMMAVYICGGAALFAHTHNWPYLNALFFCFGSLTTIGFGDLKPSSLPQNTVSAQLQLLGAAFYLLIGMALIATCFNLMQEQVTSRGGGSTVLTRKLGGLVTTPTPHQRFHLDDTWHLETMALFTYGGGHGNCHHPGPPKRLSHSPSKTSLNSPPDWNPCHSDTGFTTLRKDNHILKPVPPPMVPSGTSSLTRPKKTVTICDTAQIGPPICTPPPPMD